MRKSLVLCLLAITAVAGNAFAGAEARLTGKVLDSITKAPVADVTIVVVSTGARGFKGTFKGEKGGTYRFLLIDGTLPYQMTWSAPGYQPYSENVKLKIGDTASKDVFLKPTTAAQTEAVQSATPATAEPPKRDPAIDAYNEGAQFYNTGKHAEAMAKFEEAVAAKPDLIAGWQALAKVYLAQKNYEKAVTSANKVLELDSEEIAMYGVLHAAYTALGEKAKAAEAKAKMPADARSLFNDAARLINANKDKDAEVILKQAIVADDTFASAYYELGMLYVRSGKNAEARTNLNKYLELEPSGKDASTAKEMLKFVK